MGKSYVNENRSFAISLRFSWKAFQLKWWVVSFSHINTIAWKYSQLKKKIDKLVKELVCKKSYLDNWCLMWHLSFETGQQEHDGSQSTSYLTVTANTSVSAVDSQEVENILYSPLVSVRLYNLNFWWISPSFQIEIVLKIYFLSNFCNIWGSLHCRIKVIFVPCSYLSLFTYWLHELWVLKF